MISRILAAGLIAALGLHYLIWRISSSLNFSSMASSGLSLAMLAAELLLLGSAFLQLLFSSLPGPDYRVEINLAAEKLATKRLLDPMVSPRLPFWFPAVESP